MQQGRSRASAGSHCAVLSCLAESTAGNPAGRQQDGQLSTFASSSKDHHLTCSLHNTQREFSVPSGVPVWHGAADSKPDSCTNKKSVQQHSTNAFRGFVLQVWTHLAHKLHDLIQVILLLQHLPDRLPNVDKVGVHAVIEGLKTLHLQSKKEC